MGARKANKVGSIWADRKVAAMKSRWPRQGVTYVTEYLRDGHITRSQRFRTGHTLFRARSGLLFLPVSPLCDAHDRCDCGCSDACHFQDRVNAVARSTPKHSGSKFSSATLFEQRRTIRKSKLQRAAYNSGQHQHACRDHRKSHRLITQRARTTAWHTTDRRHSILSDRT